MCSSVLYSVNVNAVNFIAHIRVHSGQRARGDNGKPKVHGEEEHRDLHNMYGMLYTMATHQGHLVRSDNKLRPFILTNKVYPLHSTLMNYSLMFFSRSAYAGMLGPRDTRRDRRQETTPRSGATSRPASPCVSPSA